MNRVMRSLLALVCLTAAGRLAHAADNGTEFGIEDDLTVLGSTGTWGDPDVELRGFTVFGPLAGPQVITSTNGNVAIRGNLQVDSTSYFGSSVTIAGSGVFLSTVNVSQGMLKYGAGAAGQVMKSGGDGYVYWGTDNSGAVGGTAFRVPMWDNTSNAFVSSPLQGNSNTPTNLTLISGSSLTINGPFESTGTVKLGNATVGLGEVTIAGAATAQNGLSVTGITSLNGAIILGDASADLLTMNAQASFIGGSTFTAAGGGAYFLGISSFSDVAKVHYGGGTAGQVLSKVAGGAMQWTSPSALGAGDNLGNHIATITVTANFGIIATTITATGNTQLGDLPGTDYVGVNGTGDATTALKVIGEDASNKFSAKFYSGANLAAWVKKK